VFTAAVELVFDRIAAQPNFYAAVFDDVREALVPEFPYCVYYREEPAQVLVLSVFHTSRDPAVWQGRA
jgi:toxin ParE1/3/4